MTDTAESRALADHSTDTKIVVAEGYADSGTEMSFRNLTNDYHAMGEIDGVQKAIEFLRKRAGEAWARDRESDALVMKATANSLLELLAELRAQEFQFRCSYPILWNEQACV